MKISYIISIFLVVLNLECVKSQNQNNVKYYEKELNSPTSNTEALKHYQNGYYAFVNGKFKAAVVNYKLAFQTDSNYTDAIDNCALSFRKMNMLDSAEYYYKMSLKKMPQNDLAMHNLGLVYIFKNNFKAAKNTFKELIRNNPTYGDGYYSLSEVYLRENNNDSAIVYSNMAYEIWKDKNPVFAADALYYSGLGYLQKGDKKLAMEYFLHANKLGKNISPEIQKRLLEK